MTEIFDNDKFNNTCDMQNQHLEMLKRVENLINACIFKKETKEITDILVFIESYLSMHIKSEETLMRLLDYHEYCSHKIKHTELLEVFEKCKKLFSKEENSLNFIMFLKQEFINKVTEHFNSDDIELNDFIKSHCEI